MRSDRGAGIEKPVPKFPRFHPSTQLLILRQRANRFGRQAPGGGSLFLAEMIHRCTAADRRERVPGNFHCPRLWRSKPVDQKPATPALLFSVRPLTGVSSQERPRINLRQPDLRHAASAMRLRIRRLFVGDHMCGPAEA